jgi:galactonate dehydratase
MKITDFETYVIGNPWKRWVFAKLLTSNGRFGISEATLYQESAAVVSELNEKRSFFIGKDPMRIEAIWSEWYRDSFARNSSAVSITALSAIEVACWDLVGKELGCPIYTLLGGNIRDRVKLYANGWYTHLSSPEEYAAKASKVVQMGYGALKVDPFGTSYMSPHNDQIKSAVKIIQAIREAVGEDIDILVEGHGRFTPESAIRIAKLMEPLNPRWFEEPVPPEDVEALLCVKNKTTIPIATGERLVTKYAFAPLLDRHAVDIIQPDIVNTGGILEAKKISSMAEAHYVTVAPHQAEGPIATATCLQLDACIPNFEIQESFDEFDVGWRKELLTNGFEIIGGQMSIPDTPGLGIELNMKAVEAHLAKNETDFNLFSEGWENRNLPRS